MEIFPEINKGVVPNKHVVKKLRNVSQYKLVAIFWFDSTLYFFCYFYTSNKEKSPLKVFTNQFFALYLRSLVYLGGTFLEN